MIKKFLPAVTFIKIHHIFWHPSNFLLFIRYLLGSAVSIHLNFVIPQNGKIKCPFDFSLQKNRTGTIFLTVCAVKHGLKMLAQLYRGFDNWLHLLLSCLLWPKG